MKKLLTFPILLRWFAAIFLFSFGVFKAKAQPWPNATWTSTGTCTGNEPEITKVFVDACYDPEEKNEFVYMKTGATGWDCSNFSINGGALQNPPTVPLLNCGSFAPASASMITTLNAGVGYPGNCPTPTFIAGTNPLPPNAVVMVYPYGGGNTNVTANSITYMCGKGTIYVIAGNWPGTAAFFRNGTATGSGNKTTEFNFGPCKKTLVYNNQSPANFPPSQGSGAGSTGYGVFVTGAGVVGVSECFEPPLCVGPPNPIISNPTISICEGSAIPTNTSFNCTNCTTGNYSVYTSPTALNPIYVGNAFPNSSFFPPNTTTTYYIEQSGFCPSGKTAVTLQVNPNPQNSPNVPATLTCANPTVTLTGTISTGTNFAYSWSGPSGYTNNVAYPTFSALSNPPIQAGDYYLTVTNTTTGCTKTVQFPISTNANFPVITPTPDKTINCITTTAIIGSASSSSPVSYAWSNGGTTAVQVINLPGTYIVSVTNTSNGCVKKDTVVVTLNNTPPTLSPIAAVTVNCTTPNPTLVTAATGGTGLTYAWTPGGATSPNLQITTGGTYTVSVTNPANGCKSSTSITVMEDKTLPSAIIATPQTLTCSNNATITLNTTGTSTGSNFTYNWSGPNGFSSNLITPPNVTVEGTYNLTVTNSTNGCTKTANVTVLKDVTLPIADAGSPKELNCYNNQSVLIGGTSSAGPNFIYQWSNPSINTITQTVTFPGTYTITVTNIVNGCIQSASVVVTQDIVAPVMNPIAPVAINCYTPNPTIVTSTVGNNLAYVWTPSGSGANPTVTVGGVYSVTVTNTVNGCKDTKSVNVTEDKVLPSATIAPPSQITCVASSVTLNASASTGANISYAWSGPNNFSSNVLSPIVTNAGTYTLLVTNTTNGCTKTASEQVTQATGLPVADAGADKTLGCTFTSVSLGGNSSTGANFTYVWSGTGIVSGANTPTPIVNQAGTYTLTVTNTANGCKKSDEVVVSSNTTPPSLSITPTNTTLNCTNPTTTLAANGTGSFVWSTGQNTQNIFVMPSITMVYNVTITDLNGCKNTKNVTIYADFAIPYVSTTTINSPLCVGSNLVLSTSGGTAYNWSGPNAFTSSLPNNTINNISAANAGTYNLTITGANGCTVNIQKTLLVNALPNAAATANTPCVSSALNLSATGGTQYIWSGVNAFSSNLQNPIIPNVTASNAGIYTVTVTDANGCSKTAQVTATVNSTNAGTINTTSNSPICEGNTLNLNASGGANYAWSGPNNFSSSLQNPVLQNANGSKSGTYQVTVTSTNGCITILQTATAVNLIPVGAVASNSPLCSGNTLNLEATGGTQYVWSGPNGFVSGLQNPSISNISTANVGTYSVTISANNCSVVKQILVNVNSGGIAATATNNSPICEGETLVFASLGGGNYAWSGPNGFNSTLQNPTIKTITSNASGAYSLTVTAANGCSAQAQTFVNINAAPQVTASSNSPLCTGNTITLISLGGINYKWTGPNSFASTIQNPTITNATSKNSGTYTVDITDKNNCSNTTKTDVVVNECTATNDISQEKNIVIFPNPVENLLRISSIENITNVILTNSIGQAIFTKKENNKEITIEMSHFASGTYTLTVQTTFEKKVFKVVKI